jgi:hypothetical protein
MLAATAARERFFMSAPVHALNLYNVTNKSLPVPLGSWVQFSSG